MIPSLAMKQLCKPKFVICLTKFVMDLTIRTCPIFNSGCTRLRDRHYKGNDVAERIIWILAKGHDQEMVGAFKTICWIGNSIVPLDKQCRWALIYK